MSLGTDRLLVQIATEGSRLGKCFPTQIKTKQVHTPNIQYKGIRYRRLAVSWVIVQVAWVTQWSNTIDFIFQ